MKRLDMLRMIAPLTDRPISTQVVAALEAEEHPLRGLMPDHRQVVVMAAGAAVVAEVEEQTDGGQ